MSGTRPAPTVATWGTLSVALLAVSTSGPLMAAIAAPALAIAFWRNALAATVLAPVTTVRLLRDASARPDRRTVLGCLLAGVTLAAHFGTWIPSVTMTSVATATALVSAQPVWAALIAVRGGARFPRRFWVGLAFALVGVTLMTGADVAVSTRALVGDGLALLGGALAAAYVTVGARVRETTSTTTYTTFCYGTCAVALLVVCLTGGVRLGAYPGSAWLLLAAVTVGPQFLGHSLVNSVLGVLSPTTVSVAMLLEVPVAALLALVFLDQTPPILAIPGIVVLLLGLGLVVLASRPAPDDVVPEL